MNATAQTTAHVTATSSFHDTSPRAPRPARRCLRYDAPTSWEGFVRGHTIYWVPPEDPSGYTSIALGPVVEGVSNAEDLLDELSFDAFETYAIHGPTVLYTHAGLCGAMWEVLGTLPGGEQLYVALVVLRDERHVYPLRLTTPIDRVIADIPVLFSIVHSLAG